MGWGGNMKKIIKESLYLLLTKKGCVFEVLLNCLIAMNPNKTSGGVVQLVRTSACHAEGREFESRLSRHNIYAVVRQRFLLMDENVR